MADGMRRPENEEHGSEPHLPSPTIWPFGFAAGIALALVGLIVSWPIVFIGAVIAVVFGFLWAREATREVRGTPPPEPEPHEEERYAALEEDEGEHRYSRSRFLEASTLGIGALIGGVVTVPALGFMILPAFRKQAYEHVDLGPLDNYPQEEWRIATFESRLDGGQVTNRTVFVRNNGIVNEVPSFTIISNRCVHLGCPVRPQGLSEEREPIDIGEGRQIQLAATNPSGFVCPCHGGAYDTEGNVTAGPPVRALDRYEYSILEGRLVLVEPYSVGKVEGEGAEARIEAYQIADPGQHVDGLQQYFYPPKFWIR
ncbi:MAG: ubiquinol-cytochrome c reductase iron-sulfur subunit [Actinobacteria bacterium]|nr:ubiquinol-cytochrome c reductase iron-sulfur subunit [Actinomycetota bacterium]